MGMMPIVNGKLKKHKKPHTPLKRADAVGEDQALEASKAKKTINKKSTFSR